MSNPDEITITVLRTDLSSVLAAAAETSRVEGLPLAAEFRIREACSKAMQDPSEPWHEAGVEVDYRWSLFKHARTPLDQANALVDLSNSMHDLRTFLPGYDYETGTLPWERDLDD